MPPPVAIRSLVKRQPVAAPPTATAKPVCQTLNESRCDAFGLPRLDEQEVDWAPDRSAPVRVAAEQPRAGFAGLVADFVRVAIDDESIRVLEVVSTHGPHAVVAQELLRVQHALE